MVQSDDVEVTVEETKHVKLTGACAAYIEDVANVTVATRTAAVGNGTAVATGCVGTCLTTMCADNQKPRQLHLTSGCREEREL